MMVKLARRRPCVAKSERSGRTARVDAARERSTAANDRAASDVDRCPALYIHTHAHADSQIYRPPPTGQLSVFASRLGPNEDETIYQSRTPQKVSVYPRT